MKRLTIEEITRQAERVREHGPRRLPAAWFERGCAAVMADWIGRNVPAAERRTFTYGATA